MDSAEQIPRSKRHKQTTEGAVGTAGTAYGAEAARQPKENFFNRVAQMNSDDWDRHRIYVYRRWPRISRDDQPHYIGTHRQAIDEEFIRAQYGSGRYLLKLNDPKRTVDQTPLEIQDIAYPPKLNVGELVDCPENERYFKLWPSDAHPKGSAANDGNDSAIKELTGLLKIALTDKPPKEQDDVTRTLVDWALRQKEREREEGSPSSVATLISALKGFMPAQTAPAAPPVDVLAIIAALKGLQPEPPDMLALLQQAREIFAPQENPAASDDFARFEKFLTVADRLASYRRGESARSGWDVGLDFAKELGPTVFQPLFNIINNALILRSQQRGATAAAPGAPGVTPTPLVFDPYRNPEQARVYAQNLRDTPAPAAATPPPAAPRGAAESEQTPPAARNELTHLLAQYGGLLVGQLNAGVSGADFATWLIDGFGLATWSMIAGEGQETLTQAMLTIPELKLFGEPHLRRFTSEFINYEAVLAENEEEPEEETTAAASRK